MSASLPTLPAVVDPRTWVHSLVCGIDGSHLGPLLHLLSLVCLYLVLFGGADTLCGTLYFVTPMCCPATQLPMHAHMHALLSCVLCCPRRTSLQLRICVGVTHIGAMLEVFLQGGGVVLALVFVQKGLGGYQYPWGRVSDFSWIVAEPIRRKALCLASFSHLMECLDCRAYYA